MNKILFLLLAAQILSVCSREPVLPPRAVFLVSKQKAEINEVIRFTNRSLRASTYSWEFGDNENSEQEHPSHFYTEEGKYTVYLQVENSLGTGDTLKIIEVFRPAVLWPAPGDYQGYTMQGGKIELKITANTIESFEGSFFADIAGEDFELHSSFKFGAISKTDSGFVAYYNGNRLSGTFSGDTISGFWRHNYGEESFIISKD